MKIVQINAVYRVASTGRTTMEMHEYCIKHGIESYVFCTNINDEANQVYCIGSKLDHKIHALCSRVWGKQAFFSPKNTKKLLSKLDAITPDVVILRNLHANYIHLPLLLDYLANKDIPTIACLHDCWLFTGHCTHYFSIGCYKWQKECHNCELMRKDNMSLFFDTSRYMFNKKKELFGAIPRLGVIGVSDWITDEARKSVIMSNAKLFQRVYNWIDLKKFYPRDTANLRTRLKICDEFVVLGVSSSWNERKGLYHFVKLAQTLKDVKVILVGNLVEKIPKLENLINVERTSNVDELAEYYSLASVLLVCSPQETFGKVAAEALACGTPVISNAHTANPEVPGNICGIITHNSNDNEIINAIQLIRDRGKSYYHDKCIQRAHENFNSEEQIKEYIGFAKKLIEET